MGIAENFVLHLSAEAREIIPLILGGCGSTNSSKYPRKAEL